MSFLFVALDYSDFRHAYNMVRQLDAIEGDFGYKLNLDFIVSNPDFYVGELETSRPVFADMKMWNGVRTMVEVCRNLQQRGFGYTNIHALCGIEMMTELMKEINIGIWKVPRIKILGVTVLTHYDNEYCTSQFRRGMELEVVKLVGDSVVGGIDGVILPGPFLRELRGIRITKLVPAVRPEVYEEKRKDQKQTMSVREAVRLGADMLVCGSPITKFEDPQDALVSILNEMEGV